MRAAHDTEIVEKLWGRDCPECSRSVEVRETNRVVESVVAPARTTRKWQHVRKGGICFALRKQEHKSRKTSRKFVHNARGNRLAITDGQILRCSEYFTQRRKTRKHLWPRVQRVALPRVLVGLKPSDKHRIPLVETVIDPNHVVGTFVACRRIPYISGGIQAVTDDIRIRQWIRFEQGQHFGIGADPQRIVSEHIE